MPRHLAITVYELNASLACDVEGQRRRRQRQAVDRRSARLLNDGDVILRARRFVFSDQTPPHRSTAAPRQQSPAYLASESSSRGRGADQSFDDDRARRFRGRLPSTIRRVSRFHAEVRREAGGFALHSLGSAGTLLNGRKVTGPMLLAEGDVIEIARPQLAVHAQRADRRCAWSPRDNPSQPSVANASTGDGT